MATKETYGELRARLDETMTKLQSPECDIDSAVKLYEEALGYVAKLEKYLQSAENRVTKIQADFDALAAKAETEA